MGLGTSRTNLVTSLKGLKSRWERVRAHWDDQVARDFEQEFVASLENKVRAGVNAIEKMDELLAKVRRDCG